MLIVVEVLVFRTPLGVPCSLCSRHLEIESRVTSNGFLQCSCSPNIAPKGLRTPGSLLTLLESCPGDFIANFKN